MFSSRRLIFWVVFSGGAGVVGTIAGIGVAIVLMVILITSVFVPGGGPSTQAAAASSGVAISDINVSQTWTGQKNQGVVTAALEMTPYLYVCGPNNHDQCWHDGFPQAAINYMNTSCGNCWEATNGQLQCVMLVVAAYGISGQDLPIARDAHFFWPDYAGRENQGWDRISNDSMPEPGDIIVWEGPTATAAGHVAIVIDVKPPTPNAAGYIQFAEANGPSAVVQEPLTQDKNGPGVHVQTWPNYVIDGYIRHQSAVH